MKSMMAIWERMILCVSSAILFSVLMSVVLFIGYGQWIGEGFWYNLLAFLFLLLLCVLFSLPGFLSLGIVGTVFIQNLMDKIKWQTRKIKYIGSLVCYAGMGAAIAQIYPLGITPWIDHWDIALLGMGASFIYFHLLWHREFIFKNL